MAFRATFICLLVVVFSFSDLLGGSRIVRSPQLGGSFSESKSGSIAVGGSRPGFGGPSAGFGGQRPGFVGGNAGFGGRNQGIGGPNIGVVRPNQGIGGLNSGIGGRNSGFGGRSPGFGGPGGVQTPVSGSFSESKSANIGKGGASFSSSKSGSLSG